MEREIKNKIIVVTGAAEGIGYQIARNYLKAKAKLVVFIDINEKKGNETVAELTEAVGPNKAVFIKCDIYRDLDDTYQKIIDQFGTVDVLINNAGLGNEEVPENCVNINLTATIKWSLKFMELMRKDVKGNGGTIINIASIFGYRTTHLFPVYTATKFGVVGFTKSLGHKRYYDQNQVRVFAICPGFTTTNATKEVQASSSKLFVELRNNHEWQSAEEVGEKAIEVFKIANSGTLWEIEGGILREV